jgi:hypothetical protein
MLVVLLLWSRSIINFTKAVCVFADSHSTGEHGIFLEQTAIHLFAQLLNIITVVRWNDGAGWENVLEEL